MASSAYVARLSASCARAWAARVFSVFERESRAASGGVRDACKQGGGRWGALAMLTKAMRCASRWRVAAGVQSDGGAVEL